MTWLHQLFSKKSDEQQKASVCPNCWGTQEYEAEGTKEQSLANRTLNLPTSKGWVMDYMEKYLLRSKGTVSTRRVKCVYCEV